MLPVDVTDRVEFLSDGWIDAARRFLEDAVVAEPALATGRYAVCESFTDAPPGMGLPNDRAVWHFVVDDGRVTAARGDLDDADLRVDGDYQAILSIAQTVYAAGPEAVARAQRELAHRTADNPTQIRGALAGDPAAIAVIGSLHDHLAARTVENPDLDHRVRRLGLERHVRELDELGYTVIERAVTETMADELREVVEREVLAHHPFTTNGLLVRDRLFEEVAQQPLACAAVESVVGRGFLLGAMSGTYKEAGPGLIGLHADYPLIRNPFPDFGLIAVACWVLEDWTEDAGPTWVIPGSHRWKRAPTRQDTREGGVPIVCPKGSIALWGNGVWHWQGDRTAPAARVTIHVTYNRLFVRPLDDLSAVSEEMYARNPPAFATLMGCDDPFGKSSYTGHDGARFAYAARGLQLT
jgi:ectoine hydroxylase-related dioxygenase (phytanoyl-CoA dioxygenase family)